MRSLQSSLIMPFTVSFSSVSSSLNPFRKNGHKNTTVRFASWSEYKGHSMPGGSFPIPFKALYAAREASWAGGAGLSSISHISSYLWSIGCSRSHFCISAIRSGVSQLLIEFHSILLKFSDGLPDKFFSLFKKLLVGQFCTRDIFQPVYFSAQLPNNTVCLI